MKDMIKSVCSCIQVKASDMFKTDLNVDYNESLDRIVVKMQNDITDIKDTKVKTMYTSVIKKFIEMHFPFLKADYDTDDTLVFTKTLWLK